MKPDATLLRRAAATQELTVSGALDGALALSYVIWPTHNLEQASERRQRCDTDEDSARAG